jgi:glycosyltransferase involved in cell wall biosynthesis
MRICIITYKFVKGDGQGRVNYEIAKEALNKSHKLILVGSEISDDLRKNQKVKSVIIKADRWPTDLLRNLVFAYKSARWLKKHKKEYDLLVANGFITFFPSDINEVHFVHNAWMKSSVHTSKVRKDFYGFYQWVFTKFNSYMEKIAFRKSRRIVAVSDQVKNELVDIRIDKNKIQTILNGVDIDEFYPGKTERRKLGLPEKVPLALFVGDIKTSRKNLGTVLRALQKISELHLAVVGDKKDSPYVQLTKKLNLTERVHFLGYRKDISEVMRAADMFVFPSRYEACSLVLLEAIASGLPVVTAKTAGGSEIITPRAGMLLDDPNDHEKLAESINYLIRNPEKRKDMGKEARKIAERHTWKSMAEQYISLFEKIHETKNEK